MSTPRHSTHPAQPSLPSEPVHAEALAAPSRARAAQVIAGFSRATIAIAGDVMLDHFVMGRVNRISPEAPVPVVEFIREEYRPGGAANVARNVRALGGMVTLTGVVGRDAAADRLMATLAEHGVDITGILAVPDRPTTTKMRIVTDRNQQVARVDYESDVDVTGEKAS
jgi:D-beta-D-heptose 7-phosphate kinase/D-beta-D-heptose 1-phosphate adenosyltransferase